MPLATKNGAIIVKDGKLAENCGCCGDWYCYKCEDGFSADCRNFGSVSINGNSTFEPRIPNSATSAGTGGCFEVQNGLFFQRKSSTLCELWSIAQGFDDCSKEYRRWVVYPEGTDATFATNVTQTGVWRWSDVPNRGAQLQSQLTISVSYSTNELCGDVSTRYKIVLGGVWKISGVYYSSTSSLWQGYSVAGEYYGITRYIELKDLSPDGSITFSTSSIFSTTPWRVEGGTGGGVAGYGNAILSPRPPSMDIVLRPTIFQAGCNSQ